MHKQMSVIKTDSSEQKAKGRERSTGWGEKPSFYGKPESAGGMRFKKASSAPSTPSISPDVTPRLSSSTPLLNTNIVRSSTKPRPFSTKYHQRMAPLTFITEETTPELYRRTLVYKTAPFRTSNETISQQAWKGHIIHRNQFVHFCTSQLNGVQALKLDAAQRALEMLFKQYDDMAFTRSMHHTFQLIATALLDMSLCTSSTRLRNTLFDYMTQLITHYNQMIQTHLLIAMPRRETATANSGLETRLLDTVIDDARMMCEIISLWYSTYYQSLVSDITIKTIKLLWTHPQAFWGSQDTALNPQLETLFALSQLSFELDAALFAMVSVPPDHLIVRDNRGDNFLEEINTTTYVSIKSILAICCERIESAEIDACISMLAKEHGLLEAAFTTHYIALSAIEQPFNRIKSTLPTTPTTLDAFGTLMSVLKKMTLHAPVPKYTEDAKTRFSHSSSYVVHKLKKSQGAKPNRHGLAQSARQRKGTHTASFFSKHKRKSVSAPIVLSLTENIHRFHSDSDETSSDSGLPKYPDLTLHNDQNTSDSDESTESSSSSSISFRFFEKSKIKIRHASRPLRLSAPIKPTPRDSRVSVETNLLSCPQVGPYSIPFTVVFPCDIRNELNNIRNGKCETPLSDLQASLIAAQIALMDSLYNFFYHYLAPAYEACQQVGPPEKRLLSDQQHLQIVKDLRKIFAAIMQQEIESIKLPHTKQATPVIDNALTRAARHAYHVAKINVLAIYAINRLRLPSLPPLIQTGLNALSSISQLDYMEYDTRIDTLLVLKEKVNEAYLMTIDNEPIDQSLICDDNKHLTQSSHPLKTSKSAPSLPSLNFKITERPEGRETVMGGDVAAKGVAGATMAFG